MKKQALYLLPGTMCDQRLWQPMAKALEKLAPNVYQLHYLTIARLDTIDGIMQDIKRKIGHSHHNMRATNSSQSSTTNVPSALIGFSLGGYLATEFTLQYPQLVKKLMLVANMSGTLPEKELKERKRTIDWLKHHGYNGIPLKRMHALLDESARSKLKLIETIKSMDADLGQETLIHQLEVTTKRHDLLPAIVASPIPTHFCIGDSDCLVDREKVSRYCEASEYAELSILKNTGHMLPLENPENLAEVIHRYFSTS